MSTLQKRLAELFPEPQPRGLRAEIAKLCGVKPASVSNWFSNPEKVGTISRENAERLIARFGLPVAPAWLAEGKLPKSPNVPRQELATTVTSPAPIPGEPVVTVPILANAGSMGGGIEALHEDVVVGALSLSEGWVTKYVRPTRLAALRFIHGFGDSMSPTFEDGDILLVDTGVRDPQAIDGVYVLAANGRLYIKRVRCRLDGSTEVSSDNPTVKTVDVLSDGTSLDVLGRVVWCWNGRKL